VHFFISADFLASSYFHCCHIWKTSQETGLGNTDLENNLFCFLTQVRMKVPIFGARMWLWKMRYLHEESLRRISISPWSLVPYSSYSDTTAKKFKATPLQVCALATLFFQK